MLIIGLTAAGALVTLVGGLFSGTYAVVLVLGFIIGGVANPLYSLIIAYTNDFLQPSDMAAASGGLLFINGLGAMTGPLLIGALMTRFGADAFFAYIGALFALIAAYALYRMTEAAGAAGRGDLLLRAGAAAGLAGRARGRAGGRDRARRRGGRPRLRPLPFLRALGDTAQEPTGGGMDTRGAGDPRVLAGRGRAGRLVPRRSTALDATIRERWLRALGDRRAPAACASGRARRARLPRAPRSCSTSSRATCSAATPRAFASDARALDGRQDGDPARPRPARRRCRSGSSSTLPLMHSEMQRQPGPGGAAVPAELRPRRAPPPCPRASRRSSAASAASPSATPRSGARARRRRWPSSTPGGYRAAFEAIAAVSRAALAAAREMG